MAMQELLEFEQKVASTLTEPRDIGMAYVNLGNELAGKGMDSSVPAFKALHIFKGINDANGVVQATMIIANHLFHGNQHNHALNYLKLADSYLGEDGDAKLKAYILEKIGFIYLQQKQYPESIDHYMKCAEMLEALGDLNEIPKIYSALGLIYKDLNQDEQSNEMFQKASKIARDAGNVADAEKYESFIM
jgi:tetratricopeptide (TPR) repeat protein